MVEFSCPADINITKKIISLCTTSTKSLNNASEISVYKIIPIVVGALKSLPKSLNGSMPTWIQQPRNKKNYM